MPRADEARSLEDRVFTVPNALSLLRLIMVPVVLAGLTDFLDAKLARRAGPTRLGQILDPVADRLMLSSVAVVLAIRGLLPVWAVAILVGRDLLALLGSLVVGSKIRVNRVGKAATAVLMGAVALVVISPGVVGEVIFYAGFGLSIVAGLMYAWRMRRIYRQG